MPRTVAKILKEDENKADPQITREELEQLNADDEDLGFVQEPAQDTGEKVPTAEETVAKLQKDLADEKAARIREATGRREAEERAANANAATNNAAQAQIGAHEAAIGSKITAAKTNLESIKTQLKTAKATGDGDAEVELQDALTNARYELNTAEWEQKNFNTWKTNQENVSRQQAAAPKSPYTAKEQAWIDAHPEFQTNKKFARLAKMVAQEALDEGHKQDSVGYFNYIENAMKEGGFSLDGDEPMSGAGTNTNSSTSIAAAPDRSGNNSAAVVVNKNSKYPYLTQGFRIPPDWVQAAKDQDFDDVREYANMRLEEEAKQKGNT